MTQSHEPEPELDEPIPAGEATESDWSAFQDAVEEQKEPKQ